MSERREELIPALGVVTEIRKDTPDVKTFRVVTPDGKKAFEHKPGQCAMLSVPGVGEGMPLLRHRKNIWSFPLRSADV